MLSRVVAASLRRNGSRVPSIGSPALLGDVLPPLQWDRMFSSETTEGGEQAPAAAAAATAPRKRIRKPTRAAAGSWETCAELDDLLRGDAAHRVPAGANLYDLRSSLPYFFDNSRHNEPLFEAVARAAAEAGVDVDAEEEEEEAGGEAGTKKRRIVQWETNAVLETVAAEVGGGASSPAPFFEQQQHPINRKVGLRVHLGDLAGEAGLSDAAARWVALVAGPRYDPRSGVLRLTDERGGSRAENARSCARMLSALVAEGKRKHP